jgi:hypothetical protein
MLMPFVVSVTTMLVYCTVIGGEQSGVKAPHNR